MSIIPRPIRNLLKRSDTILALNAKARWQIYLLKDWWGTKVWTRTVEVVTPLGFKLTSGLHPAYEMMRRGTFEPEETAILQEHLTTADLFIDIGANLGYYTCLALQNEKQVVAFEPQPQNLRCLYQNLVANGWQDREVEILPLALSDRPGMMTLYGASGPSASLIRGWAGYSAKYEQTVPVSTVDSILACRFSEKRLLIKIDVEGAEYQVLKGALATLARTPKPVWLLEVCLHEFHPDGANPQFRDVFELFWEHGYQAFAATTARTPVSRADVDRWVATGATDSGTFNYLFTAP